MFWDEAVREQLVSFERENRQNLPPAAILKLIDLTSLNDTDTEDGMAAFFAKASTPAGCVAAVCVQPRFVHLAAKYFAGMPVRVATVANFPHGNISLRPVLQEIERAITDGAKEVDVVFPYHLYLAGKRTQAASFVAACRVACGDSIMLKVILETGALQDCHLIADASRDALLAGADFIKTSTGKIPEGASLDAAAAMLLSIRETRSELQKPVGLKVAGGIREVEQAAQYIALAEHIMGQGWVMPSTFRIGASRLVEQLHITSS